MLQADYTRKTMELAEQRKALEVEKGKLPEDVAQKLNFYESKINPSPFLSLLV
jgi:hypothetical protein